MKVEFNQNGFSANMGYGATPSDSSKTDNLKNLLISNKPFVLGIAALIIAIANLPFGLFMNIGADALGEFLNTGLLHLTVVMAIISILIIAVSVVCGIFSVVLYAKSHKSLFDIAGLILSIFSFVISAADIVLNIVVLATL